jgi:formylglycine-generating enzyme required for sulfatase activity
MKQLIVSIFLLLCLGTTNANNIQISNISLVPANGTIKFDLTWDNSWRSSVLNNWDAAYVFFKYKGGGEPLAITRSGINDYIPPGFSKTAYGFGTMIYRSVVGSGTCILTNVEIGITNMNGTLFNGDFDIMAFAIEMVYIPTGAYTLGDGSTNSIVPTTIGANANFILSDPLAANGGYVASTPSTNGYNAFYCMKYELSQGGYRDFLNSLSYAQQVSHVVAAPNSATGTAALYNTNRNYIKIKTPGSQPAPAIFGCDANGNGIYDEVADGEWVACNYLNWVDHSAYLAWAGLKPMTELQFEKAARGIQGSVPGEYAWGNTQISTTIYSLTNASQSSEIVNNTSVSPIGNVSYIATYSNAPFNGPLRNGIFATTATNRISSGGSFYGVMELSGNLNERVVTISNAAGDNYTFGGAGGQVLVNLTTSGFAQFVTSPATGRWPGAFNVGSTFAIFGSSFALGLMYKGGGWASPASLLRISDRGGLVVSNTNTDRTQMNDVGIRGVL